MQASSPSFSRFSHRRAFRVGIVGATGLVGDLMRPCLLERAFPVEALRLFASSRSAGCTLPWHGKPCVVEDAAAPGS
jgi:aspartate-semialdehyde dehydrogenase